MHPQLISKNEFNKGSPLDEKFNNGRGTINQIYTGTYFGAPVAMKYCKSKKLPQHLIHNYDAYYLASHPNVLQFYGLHDAGHFSTFFELMPHSLSTFYTSYYLSWENIYNFGYQIACGLNFLHSRKISHLQLKSDNIFLTHDLTIKIADFNMSKMKSADIFRFAENPVRWRAPETFSREYARIRDTLEAQVSTDVYSYGLLLWEMRTRKKPFAGLDELSILKLLMNGTREEIGFDWPYDFKLLLSDCWGFVPSSRPTMQKIIEIFNKPFFDLKNAKKASVTGYIYGNCALLQKEIYELTDIATHQKIEIENMKKENEDLKAIVQKQISTAILREPDELERTKKELDGIIFSFKHDNRLYFELKYDLFKW